MVPDLSRIRGALMAVALPYFTVRTTALDNRKVRALRVCLSDLIPSEFAAPVVEGLVVRLWQLAASRGDDNGFLGRLTNRELAVALGWGLDADRLIDALLEVRLVDEVDGGFAPHDWIVEQPGIRTRIAKRTGREARQPRQPEAKPSTPALFDTPKGAADEILLRFPLKRTGADWPLTRKVVDELAAARPTVNIMNEARVCLEWLQANPHRKSDSARGMRTRLSRWMRTAEERLGGAGPAAPAGGWRPSIGPAPSSNDNTAPWAKAAAEECAENDRRGIEYDADDVRRRHRDAYDAEQAAKSNRTVNVPNPFRTGTGGAA